MLMKYGQWVEYKERGTGEVKKKFISVEGESEVEAYIASLQERSYIDAIGLKEISEFKELEAEPSF